MKNDIADVEVTGRIQKIGTTGDVTSAVATPDGKSRKKKKKSVCSLLQARYTFIVFNRHRRSQNLASP